MNWLPRLAGLGFVFATTWGTSAAHAGGLPAAPTLAAPQRGSISGAVADIAFAATDISTGTFTFPVPMEAPRARGVLAARVFPTYSPGAALSEWGAGMATDISVTRWRPRGDFDGATDGLKTPWGVLQRGTGGDFFSSDPTHKVRLAVRGDALVAFLPDGSVWTFGSATRIPGSAGTYAWFLDSIEDVHGGRASFTYVANATGRPFLTEVQYGGLPSDPAYRVRFEHETTAAVASHLSGQRVELDRRVRDVIVEARDPATSGWIERYEYHLAYEAETTGPAFRLSSLQRTYPGAASGPRVPEPKVVFTYAKPDARLAQAAARRTPDVDALITRFGTSVLDPAAVAVSDVDDDGQPDLEDAKTRIVARRTADGFDFAPMPVAPPNADPMCKPQASPTNAPRTLATMAQPESAEVHAIVTRPSPTGAQTALRICARDGALRYRAVVDGAWDLATGGLLVDVDRDLVPDFVRVVSGSASVLPVRYASGAWSVAPAVVSPLRPAVTPEEAQVRDINGDGLPDLVVRFRSTFTVWHGLGGGRFEPAGTTHPLRFPNGTPADIGTARVEWLDANKDGLMDVLAVGAQSLDLYVNSGASFVRTAVPGFGLGGAALRPLPVDLAATGASEVAFAVQGLAYSLALDEPATGLLTNVDDGKGSVLHVEYARAPAEPGLGARPSVLRTLTVASLGAEPDVYEYTFSNGVRHPDGRFFLGYTNVERRAVGSKESVTFRHDALASGLVLASDLTDPRRPGLHRVTFSDYEPGALGGIARWRLKRQRAGWTSDAGQRTTELLREASYDTYDARECVTVQHATSLAGTTYEVTDYEVPAKLADGLGCSPSHDVRIARHADATLDNSDDVHLARDDCGNVLRRWRHTVAGDRVDEERTYTDDGLLATITRPRGGTVTFTWNPDTRLLDKVVTPEGVVTRVAERDARDLMSAFEIDRGGPQPYRQRFGYDALERLDRTWSDVDGARAEPNTRVKYAWADRARGTLGHIETSTLFGMQGGTARRFDASDVLTAGGQAVASLSRIPEGWRVGVVAQGHRSAGETSRAARDVWTGSIDDVTLADLLAGSRALGNSVTSTFGHSLEAVDAMSADAQRRLEDELALSDVLVASTTENRTTTRTRGLDEDLRPLYEVDPAGNRWSFARDAWGRVRRVTLPTGQIDRVDYDDFGKSTRVERAGMVSVKSSYELASGLLLEKRFVPLGERPASARTVTYAYDDQGRPTGEHYEDASGQVLDYRFYWDGASASDPTRRDARGALTSVEGPGFRRAMRYGVDGRPAGSTLTVTGFAAFDEKIAYDLDDVPSGSSWEVRDATGALVSSVQRHVTRDAYGRSSSITLNDAPLAAYGYTPQGLLDTVAFEGGAAARQVVGFQYDPLTRARIGMTQETPAWTAAMSTHVGARGLIDRQARTVGRDARQTAYDYDARGFLTAARDATQPETYSYDADGLLVSASGPTRTGAIKPTNDGWSHAGTDYRLDGFGRVVARGDVTYHYGPDGQIREAYRGSTRFELLYDERGQRIAKKVGGQTAVAYPHDGTSYTARAGLVEPLKIDGKVVGVLSHGSPTSGHRVELVAMDALGTPLSDTSGNTNIASAYGARTTRSDLAATIDYAAKGYDADLGLVRMGVRDYDPDAGRFVEPDPHFLEHPEACVESPVECTLYGYALNNPVGVTDPSGKCAWDLCVAEGGSTLVAAGVALGVFAVGAAVIYVNQPAQQRDIARASNESADRVREMFQDLKGRFTGTKPDATAIPVPVPSPVAPAPQQEEKQLEDVMPPVPTDGPKPQDPPREKPRYVYRGGSNSDSNLTPRPPDPATGFEGDNTGLSTYDTIEAATRKPGEKAQVIDLTKLKTLVGTPDSPPGHVSIGPPGNDPALIKAWQDTREMKVAHPWTTEIRAAIVGEARRPK